MSVAQPAPARAGGRLQLTPPADCFEFIVVGAPPDDGDWPRRPGQVARDAGGRARLLHFAPGRWLVPDPEAGERARLAALAAAGRGVLVEVSGKWQAVALAPGVAAAVLASTLEFEAVLAGREAAAVVLFDCPAILARSGNDFALWVAASYLASFTRVVDALRLGD